MSRKTVLLESCISYMCVITPTLRIVIHYLNNIVEIPIVGDSYAQCMLTLNLICKTSLEKPRPQSAIFPWSC